MDTSRTALVLGMSETGLSTLRLLGRAGVTCHALDAIEPLPAFWSRYCRRSVRLPEDTAESQIVNAIVAMAATLPPRPVIVPTSDRMVQLVSRNRTVLEPLYELLLPDPDTVEDVLDKSRFAARTQAIGAPVPKGGMIDGIKSLPEAVARYGLPLILKPVRQNDIAGTSFPKALLLRTPEDVTNATIRHCDCDDMRLMAQEYIPGDDSQQISVAACRTRDGRVLASFTARKRRQGTNGTGVGLYVERVDEPEAEAIALKLLNDLRIVGIGEVELKRHAETGRFYVIEINLRVWLQVSLPGGCGLNYPAMFYAAACGTAADSNGSRPGGFRPAAWQDLCHDGYATFRRGGYYWRGEVSFIQWVVQSLRARNGPYMSLVDPLPPLAWLFNVGRKLWVSPTHTLPPGHQSAHQSPAVPPALRQAHGAAAGK